MTNNWQEKKLSEVTVFIPTGSHSRKEMSVAKPNDERVHNIHYGDLHTKYKKYIDLKKDKVPVLNNYEARSTMLLRDGDIVMADASEDYDGLGMAAELRNIEDKKVIGGLHTFVIRSNEKFTSGFGNLLFKSPSIHAQLMKFSTHSKVYGIAKNNLKNINILIPPMNEQERIVGVIETWDEYLEKIEKLIDLKKMFKKGLMQQIFSQKLRFKDENGQNYPEWQTKKLGEISEFVNGYTFLSGFYVENGKYKVVTIANVQQGKLSTDKINRIDELPSNIQEGQILKTGDLLVSMTGNVGRICLVDEEMCLLNQRVGKLIAKNIDANYLYQSINNKQFINVMVSNGQGGAQDNLSSKDIKSYKIKIPNFEEQQKIADLLSNADNQIKKLELKKQKIELQRKFLIKNLVSGKILTPKDILETTERKL